MSLSALLWVTLNYRKYLDLFSLFYFFRVCYGLHACYIFQFQLYIILMIEEAILIISLEKQWFTGCFWWCRSSSFLLKDLESIFCCCMLQKKEFWSMICTHTMQWLLQLPSGTFCYKSALICPCLTHMWPTYCHFKCIVPKKMSLP